MSEENKLQIENEKKAEKVNEPEVLDSPLVVHKKSDASYQETASFVEMNETHADENTHTLRRHRFRKDKKETNKKYVLLFVIVILVAVIAGLYFSGNLSFNKDKNNTTSAANTEALSTTSLEEKYQGTIVVKGTYIFVNGKEVDGIKGLQDALKYEDKSTTAFTIIVETSDENTEESSDFFNMEVLPLLQQLGFYGTDTVITHNQQTGLIAWAETTTLPPTTTTTTKPSTTKAADKNE